MIFAANGLKLSFTDTWTSLSSLTFDGRELLTADQAPLFAIRLRTDAGEAVHCSAADAASVTAESCSENGVVLRYTFSQPALEATVTLTCTDSFVWRIAVENRTDAAVEWIDFPNVTYTGALRESGGDAAVLWPYNEGALIEDSGCKRWLVDPEYPSQGSYPMFPYMVFSQFTAYLFGTHGIYMGNHDAGYAPKALDFANTDNSTRFRTRISCRRSGKSCSWAAATAKAFLPIMILYGSSSRETGTPVRPFTEMSLRPSCSPR